MRVRVPATRRTNSCVAVATPGETAEQIERHALGRQHGARGARRPSSARSWPRRSRRRAPAAAISISGASFRNAAATSGRPAITPALRATTIARAGVSSRDGCDRGDVAGAAEILGERARDRGIDLERRQEGIRAEEGGGHGETPLVRIVGRDWFTAGAALSVFSLPLKGEGRGGVATAGQIAIDPHPTALLRFASQGGRLPAFTGRSQPAARSPVLVATS